MHRLCDQSWIVILLHALAELFVQIEVMQVIFLIVGLDRRLRRYAHLTGAHIHGLHPVIGPVVFDDKQSLQPHHHVHMWLYVTVVVHRSGFARRQLIGSRRARQNGYLAGDRNAIVALTVHRYKAMVSAVQVQRMWHVVTVLERYIDVITLLHTQRRGWQSQRRPCFF